MPSKTLDLTKFKKKLNSLSGVSTGFHDPEHWIDTGNYTLNKLISGDFHKGVPLGKITMFAGESGSGKSFICSGNLARNAIEAGCRVFIFDTESALDKSWLERLGIDTSDEEKIMRIGVGMVDNVAAMVHELTTGYADQYRDAPKEECPKIMIIVDSLGMLMTETEVKQNKAGDLKGDFGRKPKALNMLMRNTINNIDGLPIGVVMTNHVYLNQDPNAYEPVVAGGMGIIFSSSIVVGIKKKKLKAEDALNEEDKEGKTDSQAVGIRIGAKVLKSRYSRPFETTDIHLPWNTGMDPYSGVFEFMKVKGLIGNSGSMFTYTDANGEEVKKYRKKFTAEDFDYLMSIYNDDKTTGKSVDVEIGDVDEGVIENVLEKAKSAKKKKAEDETEDVKIADEPVEKEKKKKK